LILFFCVFDLIGVLFFKDGKETYRSDLMEFTVPDKESIDKDNIEFITVSNEPPPNDLPAYIATKEDKTEEEFDQNKKTNKELDQNEKPKEEFDQNKKTKEKVLDQDKSQLLLEQMIKQTKTKKKKKSNSKIYTCCDNAPHDIFPGIEHYFNNIMNKLPSSEEPEDDDDDVVIPNN